MEQETLLCEREFDLVAEIKEARKRHDVALRKWHSVSAISEPHIEEACWAEYWGARTRLNALYIEAKLKGVDVVEA